MMNALDKLAYTVSGMFVFIFITVAALDQLSFGVVLLGWVAYFIYFSVLYFCAPTPGK
jgi:hypothetical protein